jgi:Tfp pilus assembly protein PilF
VEIFWDENIKALGKKEDELYQRVLGYIPVDVGDIIPTQTVLSLRFRCPGKKHAYAYSPNDPIRGIQDWLPILKNESNLNKTICVFIGMGLGYSQLMAFRQRKDIFRMIILEPCLDLFCLAMKYVDLRPLLTSDKVYILAGDIDWHGFNGIINDRKFETDFLLSDYPPLFDWNPALYSGTKNKASAFATRALSAFGTLTHFGDQLFKNRMSNLTLFRESNPVDVLKGAFKGLPVVIISAGPSLGQSMDQLKKIIGKAVLIAADSAVAPLLANGIIPDIVTTLDFRDLNSEKLSPDIIKSASFSLVAGIVSSTLTSKRLPLKHLFYSFQENDTQDWLLKILKVNHQMPAVTSVALLSLSFAQMIEADPIVLVGYDFALTSMTDDHVNGAVFSYGWQQLTSNFINVRDIGGSSVNTLPHLLEFKQGFETLMKGHHRNYINATVAGAHIDGTMVQTLDAVMAKYCDKEISVDAIIDANFQAVIHSDVLSFITTAQKELVTAQKIINQVRKIIALNEKIISFLKTKKNALKNIRQFQELPSKIQSCKQKLQKLRSGLTFFMPMEEMAAEKILKAREVRELERPKNFIEEFDKESRVTKLEMAGHQHGLEVFIHSVGDLVSYLKNEDRILSRIEKKKYCEKELLALADFYLNAMDSIKAQKIIEKCMVEFPDSGQAILRMGKSYATLLDFDTAFKIWEDAESRYPGLGNDIKKTRKILTEYWLQRGNKEPSIRENCIRRVLTLWNTTAFCQELKETQWPVCHGIIAQQIVNKQIHQAESFLQLWQPVQDSTPEWYYLMAKVVSEKDEKEKALSIVESALKKQPENSEWMAFSARLLMETDQFDQGIERLETAVQLDPTQATLWEELGDTLFDFKDYTTAASAYEKCFTALPDKVDVLRKFGDCYFYTDQFEAAKLVYQSVLEKDSQNEAARANLLKIKA